MNAILNDKVATEEFKQLHFSQLLQDFLLLKNAANENEKTGRKQPGKSSTANTDKEPQITTGKEKFPAPPACVVPGEHAINTGPPKAPSYEQKVYGTSVQTQVNSSDIMSFRKTLGDRKYYLSGVDKSYRAAAEAVFNFLGRQPSVMLIPDGEILFMGSDRITEPFSLYLGNAVSNKTVYLQAALRFVKLLIKYDYIKLEFGGDAAKSGLNPHILAAIRAEQEALRLQEPEPPGVTEVMPRLKRAKPEENDWLPF
jgi:hypothetical protein